MGSGHCHAVGTLACLGKRPLACGQAFPAVDGGGVDGHVRRAMRITSAEALAPDLLAMSGAQDDRKP